MINLRSFLVSNVSISCYKFTSQHCFNFKLANQGPGITRITYILICIFLDARTEGQLHPVSGRARYFH